MRRMLFVRTGLMFLLVFTQFTCALPAGRRKVSKGMLVVETREFTVTTGTFDKLDTLPAKMLGAGVIQIDNEGTWAFTKKKYVPQPGQRVTIKYIPILEPAAEEGEITLGVELQE